ncbi:hypothetical protein [Hufsiella ginkgonis]|uniref:Uncharacterized protein n=1 Tax=Hufsiella ginkgonis TaxID=2695274 RepID=A0A7K1XY37_9SPHI|nr:hypothetical protein [Hufsiella ginkgonis]MXV15659.1 hypothetical protein [Hufsiella ginkgonis]
MSYLHSPYFVFTGDFVSDVSTVNNDPAHYNNATFASSFQTPGSGNLNGWWNPEGGATFGFQNCRMKQLSSKEGTGDPDFQDPIFGAIISSAAGRNSGKMVDLDPQWQMSSQLWGVSVFISTSDGELLVSGNIKATGFRDLQMRQQKGARVNGQPLGGMWTSVLENVVWGDRAADSPFLQQLKAASASNKLSINLSGYGYYYNHAADGRFSLGRIIGTIGPWLENEPEILSPYRRLYGIIQDANQNTFFNFSNFLFEQQQQRLTVDFSGSFPVIDSIGTIGLNSKLYMAVSKVPVTMPAPGSANVILASDEIIMIGQINYDAAWLNNTGGIASFTDLPDDVTHALANNQLLLLTPGSGGNYIVIAREAIDGLVLRADDFVCRIDCGQTVPVNLYAYQWGEPLQNAVITINMDPEGGGAAAGSQSQNPLIPVCDIPNYNTPVEGISFSQTINTDANGYASLDITGNNVNNPRGYIDGQIYTLSYALSGQQPDPAAPGNIVSDGIFIHVRNYFEAPANPSWSDISEIMVQFANLYPIMSKYFLNFADPLALFSKKEILKFAFTRDITDPVYMPVTRDLSEAKKQAILNWLSADQPVVDIGLAGAMAAEPAKIRNVPEAGAPIPEKQAKLKRAVMMKNGALLSYPEIDNLFEY